MHDTIRPMLIDAVSAHVTAGSIVTARPIASLLGSIEHTQASDTLKMRRGTHTTHDRMVRIAC